VEIIVLILVALVLAAPVSYLVMKNWLLNYAFRTNIPVWIYLVAGASTLAIAMLTIGWQSWKAAIRNPVEALRYE
jgi:putative ABC transport system permease protein